MRVFLILYGRGLPMRHHKHRLLQRFPCVGADIRCFLSIWNFPLPRKKSVINYFQPSYYESLPVHKFVESGAPVLAPESWDFYPIQSIFENCREELLNCDFIALSRANRGLKEGIISPKNLSPNHIYVDGFDPERGWINHHNVIGGREIMMNFWENIYDDFLHWTDLLPPYVDHLGGSANASRHRVHWFLYERAAQRNMLNDFSYLSALEGEDLWRYS